MVHSSGSGFSINIEIHRAKRISGRALARPLLRSTTWEQKIPGLFSGNFSLKTGQPGVEIDEICLTAAFAFAILDPSASMKPGVFGSGHGGHTPQHSFGVNRHRSRQPEQRQTDFTSSGRVEQSGKQGSQCLTTHGGIVICREVRAIPGKNPGCFVTRLHESQWSFLRPYRSQRRFETAVHLVGQ